MTKLLGTVKLIAGLIILGLATGMLFVDSYILMVLFAFYFISIVIVSDGLNMMKKPVGQESFRPTPTFSDRPSGLRNVNIIPKEQPQPEPTTDDVKLFEEWKKSLEKQKKPQPKEEGWVCKECGKKFKTEKMLRRHYGMAHYDLLEV